MAFVDLYQLGRLFAGRNVYSSASSPNWAPWYRSAGDVPARDVPAPTPDAAPMAPVEPTAPVAEPTPSDSGDSGNGKFRVVLADLVRRLPGCGNAREKAHGYLA